MTSEIAAEYSAVRKEIGMIDRSPATGRLALRGADRLSWLQGMVTNDVRLLEQGTPRLQACVLDATGHLLSDLAIMQVAGEDPYLLVEMPRVNLDKIATIFDRLLIMEDVEITDISDQIGCYSFQGPLATADLPAALIGALPEAAIQIYEADHTGSGGVDVFFPTKIQTELREFIAMMEAREIGADAQEILRVEAGIPRYGMDMDESVIALEANLGPTHISLSKGCYVGQEIIARIDSRGHTNRALTGLVIMDGDLPRHGDRIFARAEADEPAGRETGRITSVIASSPVQGGKPIALGYVRHEHRTPGTLLHFGEPAAGKAEVHGLPFYARPVAQ